MKYAALVLVVAGWAGIWAAEKVTFHSDRDTPQVIEEPDSQPSVMIKRDEVARQYLEDNWRRFGLEPGAVNVERYRVQQSLLGTHYHFRQTIGGIPVAFAEIIVSVATDSNRIFKVFNSTWPDALRNTEKKLPVLLDAADALDISWNHMRVSGPMTTLPSMDLMYFRIDGRFVLVYQVNLNLEDPAGSWSILVDAGTGKVHSVEQIDLHRHRANVDFSERRAPIADLEKELAAARQRQKALDETRNTAGKLALGTGRTFDPDPATTLHDQDLNDFSPPSAFDDAYFIRNLQGITQDPDDTYRLVGPWCQIIDFEPPTRPAETVNGNAGFFDFERGEGGFYDTMTYFHLDQNQRYIQSLGFTPENMGIQSTSIEVDADGLNGQDNSHYLSNVTSIGVNRLSFGRGGVPDNEDTDVILHEYGHAIQKWINNVWGFNADEGAMGEGFGDYWGAIYSLATPNGPLFHPEWIYSWDGHNDYWDGRFLDRLDFPYNPSRTYGPHEPYPMFYESDELWSTPLFQAALELYSMGIPLEESNRIILQGHFGLGSGLKMPVVAQATVDAAAMLYPDGPHAQVFRNAFGRHGILPLQDSYTYLSAHIPPGTADWINEIVIVNPNDQQVTITSTVFESDTSSIGLSDYTAHDPVVQTLEAGDSFTLIPEGDKQRWVRIESNLPLAGTSFLHRNREAQGEERAGIPLFADPEVNSTIILPHIPADRAQFFSSAVILNPGDTAVDLTIELFGAQGNDLSNLLSASAPNRLEAHQKWVGFLAPFAGQGLFDDSGSNELVSYVKITGTGDLAAFQLYGYVDSGNNLASSGIKALSDTSASPSPILVDHTWAIRVSRTSSDFTSFSILNPSGNTAQARVRLVYTDGTISPEQTVSIGARLKKLGLNNNGGFSFPYQDNPVFSETGDDLQAMLITSNRDLRIFELVGHNDKSTLDGAAVNLLTSHTVFANARGTLEILRVGYPEETTEEVTLPDDQPFNARELKVTFVQPGQQPTTTTYEMRPGESKSLAIPGDGGTSVIVEGTRFTAAVIDYDQADRSLTVINGQQVEFYPDEQN